MPANFIKEILKDLRVELADEFDKNFTRGSFFGGKRWKNKQLGEASHLQDTGKLRRSIRSRVQGNSIIFSSSEPYAAIHNEGGEITVTAKMKKYFWRKYYEAGETSEKAQQYRLLALKKVGSKIVIPQRQYIGNHPQIQQIAQQIAQEHLKEFIKKITK